MTLKYLLEKEFKQFFRHKFMPKLVVLFPLMIMVLMPWATTLDIKDINTIVVDHDASTMSSDLVKAVNASSYFRLRDVTESYEQAVDAMELAMPTSSWRFRRDSRKTTSGTVRPTCSSPSIR